MAFDGEYEFIPLPTIPNNALPDAMKEFISNCGMIGILPRHSFIEAVNGVKVNTVKAIEGDEEFSLQEKIMSRSVGEDFGSTLSCKADSTDDEDDRINKVMETMENNNMGIFKYLELNGMNGEKGRKFVRRIVRLALRYE